MIDIRRDARVAVDAPLVPVACMDCGQFHVAKQKPPLHPQRQPHEVVRTLVLPDVPSTPDRTADYDGWREAVAFAVLRAVREAGGGLLFPGRQRIVNHFTIRWEWAGMLRDALVDLGVLAQVDPERPEAGFVTVAQASRPGQ